MSVTEYVSAGHELGDERIAVNKRDAAENEARDAIAAFRDVGEREQRIRRPKSGDAKLDPIAFEVALADLALEREQAVRRVKAAGEAVHAARVADVNMKLPALVEEYEAKAVALAAVVEAFEQGFATLVALSWWLAEVFEAERSARNAGVRTALEAAPNDEARAQIKFAAEHLVPSSVGTDGPTAWVERPHVALFDGDEQMDPRSRSFWNGLAELCLAGRKRGRGAAGTVLLAAIDQATAKLEKR